MQRISSNFTLFFKFFIPVFWLVFFGALLVAIFVYGNQLANGFGSTSFRAGAIFFYLSGIALFYYTLLPLKRVELDTEYAYVTNYFKTYRYPWHNIAAIEESRLLTFSVGTLRLNEGGQFGERIRFIASRRLLKAFWEAHPDLKR